MMFSSTLRNLGLLCVVLGYVAVGQDTTSSTIGDLTDPGGPLSTTSTSDSSTTSDFNPGGPLSTVDLTTTWTVITLSITTTTTTSSSPTDSPTSSTDLGLPTSTDSSSTDSPTTSATSSGVPSSGSGSSTPTGAIAGGVIGGIVVLGLAAGAIFIYMRRKGKNEWRGRSAPGDPPAPPSPRLRHSWLGPMGSGMAAAVGRVTPRRNHAQRLGSVGGDSMKSTAHTSAHGHGKSSSNEGVQVATSGYSSRNASGVIAAGGATAATMGRHKSSAPRASTNGVGEAGTEPSSYDLNVFASSSSPNRARHSDPFTPISSIPSPGGTSPDGNGATATSDLSRGPSTSRLMRKPVPKYDGEEPTSPATPISPRDRDRPNSKPPVSGQGQSRPRTYSNGSSFRNGPPSAGGGAGGSGSNPPSSRNSFEAPHLYTDQKDSQSTLGGAFKFAGEKEGPIHYLIPDPPPQSSST